MVHKQASANWNSKAAYSLVETGQILSLGKSSVYNLINDRLLATIKIGRRTLIPGAAIEALLEKLQSES